MTDAPFAPAPVDDSSDVARLVARLRDAYDYVGGPLGPLIRPEFLQHAATVALRLVKIHVTSKYSSRTVVITVFLLLLKWHGYSALRYSHREMLDHGYEGTDTIAMWMRSINIRDLCELCASRYGQRFVLCDQCQRCVEFECVLINGDMCDLLYAPVGIQEANV